MGHSEGGGPMPTLEGLSNGDKRHNRVERTKATSEKKTSGQKRQAGKRNFSPSLLSPAERPRSLTQAREDNSLIMTLPEILEHPGRSATVATFA